MWVEVWVEVRVEVWVEVWVAVRVDEWLVEPGHRGGLLVSGLAL